MSIAHAEPVYGQEHDVVGYMDEMDLSSLSGYLGEDADLFSGLDLMERLSGRERALVEREADLRERERELAQRLASASDTHKEYAARSQELKKLEMDIRVLEMRKGDLEKRFESRARALEARERALEHKAREVSDWESRRESVYCELLKEEERLQRKQEELLSRESRYGDLEKELKSGLNHVARIAEKSKRLRLKEDELSELEARLAEAKDLLLDEERHLSEREREAMGLEQTILKKEETMDVWESRMHSFMALFNAKVKIILTLENALETSERQKQVLRKSCLARDMYIKKLSGDLKRYERTVASLRTAMDVLAAS